MTFPNSSKLWYVKCFYTFFFWFYAWIPTPVADISALSTTMNLHTVQEVLENAPDDLSQDDDANEPSNFQVEIYPTFILFSLGNNHVSNE